MDTNQIIYISTKKLRPHPDNPRKDLGDLTELAESIKAKGILQNLTVVPWFSEITGVGCDDPKQQEEMGYIVVIGHRRLAAAKIAGLEEVPCVISDMPLREQAATMLLENIQRNDLTLIEQAQGFQFMMDLGDSAADIAKRTGFSQTTVRRRVKLLELDPKKFEKAVNDGATLTDFAELEKIEDIDLRNKVLGDVGTSNFRWSLQQAVDKERHAKDLAFLLPKVEAFATKIENSNGLRYARQWYAKDHEEFEAPEDAETGEYSFTVNEAYGYITLYQKFTTNATVAAADPEAEKRNKDKATLEAASKTAYHLRQDFILGISNTAAKKNMAVVIEFAMMALLYDGYSSFDYEDFAKLYDIEPRLDEDGDEMDMDFDDIRAQIQKQPEKSLLTAAYSLLDSESNHYFTWNNRYQKDDELEAIYEYLEKLGYQPSDEENTLRNGTHECFAPEVSPSAPSDDKDENDEEVEDLYECEAEACPFNDREGGCQFGPYDEDSRDGDLTNWNDDVMEAVEEHFCQNPLVTEAYDELGSGGDDGEDD